MHDYLKEIERREKIENLKRDIKIFVWPAIILALGVIVYYLIFYAFYKSDSIKTVKRDITILEKNDVASSAISLKALSSSSTPNVAAFVSSSSEESAIAEDEQSKSSQSDEANLSQANLSQVSSSEAVASSSSADIVEEQIFEKPIGIEREDLGSSSETSSQTSSESVAASDEEKSPYIACFIVDTEVLNVREEPVIADNIVGKVVQNERVCAYEMYEGWIRSDEGWIYANKLRLIEE